MNKIEILEIRNKRTYYRFEVPFNLLKSGFYQDYYSRVNWFSVYLIFDNLIFVNLTK